MITINSDRLWKRLMHMATIGATPKGGVCRVALTEEDKMGRDLFVKWCTEIGCTIEIDAIGNIFARRAGKQSQLPAVLIGSHLDSQPTGGKFDGVLGVLAGLEVLETLNDQQILTQHPIEIVSWTNEEGARFAPAMIASGVFSGNFSLEYAYSREDKEGKKLGEELEKIGYNGSTPVGHRPYKATFELHIEQGPILEAKDKNIGIVTGVQGIRWYDLTIQGQETHAGPSPMHLRRDPIRGTIPVLADIYELAEKYSPDARVTIGYLDASPGVRNTVPGQIKISIDIRHPNESSLTSMDEDLHKIIHKADLESKFEYQLTDVWYASPVNFDEGCIEAVRKAAKVLGANSMEMFSGAGHDAVYVSKVAPTSMIFIPCKDGLSHNELESAKKEDVEAGTNVLLHAVLEMAGVFQE